MELRAGDQVVVISGKDKGRQARVSQVFPKKGKVIVEGVATAKRHIKPRGQTMQGGIIDKDMAIDVSNVMIVCSECGPTRVGHSEGADGRKVRVCTRCGGEL
jgi:large subunit ribosomal protein L24